MPSWELRPDLSHEQQSDIATQKDISHSNGTSKIKRIGIDRYYRENPERFKETKETSFSGIDKHNQYENLSGNVEFCQKEILEIKPYTGKDLPDTIKEIILQEEINKLESQFERFGKKFKKIDEIHTLFKDTMMGMKSRYLEQQDRWGDTLAKRVEGYKEIVTGVFHHVDEKEFNKKIKDIADFYLTFQHDLVLSEKFDNLSDEDRQKMMQNMAKTDDFNKFHDGYEKMKEYYDEKISSISDTTSLSAFHNGLEEKFDKFTEKFNNINKGVNTMYNFIIIP